MRAQKVQRICILDTDSLTKSGKSTVSFTFLGKIYRIFDEIRRMKDRCFGPEFLSLKAASCLSEFTQTWREKPAKPLRLRVLFRQIVQTWRENQAYWDFNHVVTSTGHAPPGFSPKENPAHPKGHTGCSYLAVMKLLSANRGYSARAFLAISARSAKPCSSE